MNISHLSLTGSIPSQFGHLSSLQILDLSYNRLSGAIPSSIFSIYSLKYLDLSDNQLSGPFPSFIYNMSSVIGVDLSNNRLSVNSQQMLFAILFLIWNPFIWLATCFLAKYDPLYQNVYTWNVYHCHSIISLEAHRKKWGTWLSLRNYTSATTNSKVRSFLYRVYNFLTYRNCLNLWSIDHWGSAFSIR